MKKGEMVSYISPVSIYEGKMSFFGVLRIDGVFVGCIEKDPNAESTLVVGKSGKVTGKVTVDKLNVEGAIEGDFWVSQKAEFIKGSKFMGKIFAPVLIVQEGAAIEGSINVGDEKVKECEQVTGIEYGFGQKTLHERA